MNKPLGESIKIVVIKDNTRGNYNMEQLSLDQFGRIEIPESIRQQLGINHETKLSLKIENGQLILKPLKPEPETYYEDGILVFKAEPMANTNTIIDELRIERINELISW